MLQIFINGSPAVLKSGTSFEYISENRMFSDSEDYTLAITLPLAGCVRNQLIFGNIDRKDFRAEKIRFNCEIRCRAFSKTGTATITEISDLDVKLQFLAGRSEENFDDTWDDIYVNELSIPITYSPFASQWTPAQAWNPATLDGEAVALPWVNNDSGILHNCADYANGAYAWSKDTKYLSWQPYLIFITKKICSALGYTFDFSAWENLNEYKYLLVCNCLPYAWDILDFARALPHWTVDEYFDKLGLFLRGEFTVDHARKKISFAFTEDILDGAGQVLIDQVVDEFSMQVKDKGKSCDYSEAKNLAYASCDLNMYKYYECDSLIKNWRGKYVEYDTLYELMSENLWLRTYTGGNRRDNNYSALLYAKDVAIHYIIRAIDRRPNPDGNSRAKYQYRCILQPLNTFGPRIVDESKDADTTEIEFMPVAIDFTEDKYGYAIVLAPSGYNESGDADLEDVPENDQETFYKPWIQNKFEAERSEDSTTEYYDRIYLGWWNGSIDPGGHLPHPWVNNVQVNDNWTEWRTMPFTLRLTDTRNKSLGEVLQKVDTKTKYVFKFLSDKLPDVRSVFFVRGKRYVCEKITATFTENGMSQLLKGEFWPLLD